jgi:hypothetical protein
MAKSSSRKPARTGRYSQLCNCQENNPDLLRVVAFEPALTSEKSQP